MICNILAMIMTKIENYSKWLKNIFMISILSHSFYTRQSYLVTGYPVTPLCKACTSVDERQIKAYC